MDAQVLWEGYKNTEDIKYRDELILEYLPLVKKIVNSMIDRSFNYHLREEFYSVGILGLIDAVHKYDYLRQAKFETYASIRIRGSVKDFMRKKDWISRGIREKQKIIDDAMVSLEQSLGRVPTDEEIAEKAGISLQEYFSVIEKVTSANIFSFENTLEKGLTSYSLNSDENNPEVIYERKEMAKNLAEEIKKLTEREQLVLSLYYKEELTLKEIGQVLNISESRTSQILKKAIEKIREKWN